MVLSVQEGPPSILQVSALGSGDGKGLALPTMLSAPYHLPVASRAPLTRLPRDRGNGGSQSREGSRPAQSRVLGRNLIHDDPELQIRQLPPFPAVTCVCFRTLMWADVEIFKLAFKAAV